MTSDDLWLKLAFIVALLGFVLYFLWLCKRGKELKEKIRKTEEKIVEFFQMSARGGHVVGEPPKTLQELAVWELSTKKI